MSGQKTITATNETIKDIVSQEIERLGYEADLNHIDVSNVTSMRYLFCDSKFNGDISKWDVSEILCLNLMFNNSQFKGDISNWDTYTAFTKDDMFLDSPLEEKYGTSGENLVKLPSLS